MWAAGLRTLAARGFKLPAGRRMLAQFANDGPSSWPQVDALLHDSPGELRSLVATQMDINKAAYGAGQFIGGNSYNGRISAESRTVRLDNNQIKDIVTGLERAIRAGDHERLQVEFIPKGVARIVEVGNKKRAAAR